MSEQNIFRPQYKELSEDEKTLINNIKDKAQELYNLYPQKYGIGVSREIYLGMTALEESVMWVVKGLTK